MLKIHFNNSVYELPIKLPQKSGGTIVPTWLISFDQIAESEIEDFEATTPLYGFRFWSTISQTKNEFFGHQITSHVITVIRLGLEAADLYKKHASKEPIDKITAYQLLNINEPKQIQSKYTFKNCYIDHFEVLDDDKLTIIFSYDVIKMKFFAWNDLTSKKAGHTEIEHNIEEGEVE